MGVYDSIPCKRCGHKAGDHTPKGRYCEVPGCDCVELELSTAPHKTREGAE